MRRLLLSRLIRIFTVCLVNLFFIRIFEIWNKQGRCPNLAVCRSIPDFTLLKVEHRVKNQLNPGYPRAQSWGPSSSYINDLPLPVTSKVRLFSQGFFQQFLEKAAGQKWEKMIDLTSKLGEIKDIEHNKGSKIYPQNQVILDCIMPSIPLKHNYLSIIQIWVIVSHK